MKFTDTFIRRPVLAISISLLIVLLGLQALKGMQVREYPKITNTVITVSTSYYGASASLIQGFITQPLEQAIAQADNIDYMTSKSQLGSSTITVNMKLNTDPNAALSDILAKVNSVRSQLPKESEDPSLDMSTGSSTSIMYISFSSHELNASQITDYLERVIKPQLFTVEGVAKVNLYGGTEFALRIWLDPERMAAYNLAHPGSSERVGRAWILDRPLSLDDGETTDKGYTNQRRVLERHLEGCPTCPPCARRASMASSSSAPWLERMTRRLLRASSWRPGRLHRVRDT